jgi:hypothetical protein
MRWSGRSMTNTPLQVTRVFGGVGRRVSPRRASSVPPVSEIRAYWLLALVLAVESGAAMMIKDAADKEIGGHAGSYALVVGATITRRTAGRTCPV